MYNFPIKLSPIQVHQIKPSIIYTAFYFTKSIKSKTFHNFQSNQNWTLCVLKEHLSSSPLFQKSLFKWWKQKPEHTQKYKATSPWNRPGFNFWKRLSWVKRHWHLQKGDKVAKERIIRTNSIKRFQMWCNPKAASSNSWVTHKVPHCSPCTACSVTPHPLGGLGLEENTKGQLTQ